MAWQRRPVTEQDLKAIVDHENEVYPTPENATLLEKLKSWYLPADSNANAPFAMIYQDMQDGKLAAVAIIFALHARAFERLTRGQCSELQLTSDDFFNVQTDTELGLHVYHVSKYKQNQDKFYVQFLQDLNQILQHTRQQVAKIQHKQLQVVGFAAYATSANGVGLFKGKLQLQERAAFVSREYVLERNEKIQVVTIEKDAELQDYQKQGYKILSKCAMLVTYPHEDALVWKYLKGFAQSKL